LPEGLKVSLVDDVIADMIGAGDATVPNVTTIFGEFISGKALKDAEELVRRIFSPIVASPNDQTLSWILRVIKENPDLVRQVPQTVKDEFGLRLRQAFETSGSLSEKLGGELEQIAEAYGVDLRLTLEEETAPGDSQRAS
jgi:Rad3-related DNA helicase